MGEADAPDVVAAQRLAHRRLDLVAPEGPECLPLLGMSASVKPGLLEQALPDMDVVGRASPSAAHRVHVWPVVPSSSVRELSASGSNRSENGPTASVRSTSRSSYAHCRSDSPCSVTEQRNPGGRPASTRPRAWPPCHLADGRRARPACRSVLLEGGDDLPDRLVLLGVVPLLPPHHEVGGLCAERRQNQRRGKNQGSNAHDPTSLIKSTVDYAPPRRQRQRCGQQAGIEAARSACATRRSTSAGARSPQVLRRARNPDTGAL